MSERTDHRRRTPKVSTSAHRDGLARRDSSDLAKVVPFLPPETLHAIIRHLGLEACEDLVAQATPAQLTAVFDLDLWRGVRPGQDDQFDVDRFGEWIELLADVDEAVAARTIAAADERLVAFGLSRFVRVFDLATFSPVSQSDDEPIVSGASAALECAVGGYLVRATRRDCWDAIVALLTALATGHAACFSAVMRGCRALSNSAPEIDGLDDLLPAPEQAQHDIATDREARRTGQGYCTPADARAFLEAARTPRDKSSRHELASPIAAAYLRAVPAADPAPQRLTLPPSSDTTPLPASAPLAPGSAEAIDGVLEEAGLLPARRALLEAGDARPADLAAIRALLAYAREHDAAAYAERSRELAFLANTLVAGCSVQSRSLTPHEASDAVLAVCNLGIEHLRDEVPDDFLVDHDVVMVFETGWAVLHDEVGMRAAERLRAALADLRCSDGAIEWDLRALRAALAKQVRARTPWRVQSALEVIAMLDMSVWACLRGLLDECPVMPAALPAVLDGCTTSVSATNFTFVSSRRHIEMIHAFLARLPGLLAG